MADRVHQMRLAESHAAVDEQRVVGPRRRFGHGAARRMRELVRGSDDEGVEGVARRKAARRARHDVVRARKRPMGLPAHGLGPLGGVGVLGDERHHAPLTIDFGERLVEDDRVVLVQPVAEERVRHPDAQQMPVVGDKRRRLEPGRINMLVDFGFDAGKDLVPDAAGHVRACACHCEPLLDGRLRHFRPSETLSLRPVYATVAAQNREKGRSCGLRPAETRVTTRIGARGAGRKPWLFHIFFHSCGKLRGETLRCRRGGDCSTRFQP